jgi:hypothetical protein
MPSASHVSPGPVAVAVALGTTLFILATGPPSAADEESARARAAQQFVEGLRAFDLGDFAHAADAFELAYRLVPSVDALWNAARALQRADALPGAATLYARYLREAPAEARDRNVAAALLAILAARLGCIEVHGSDIERLVVDEHPSEERVVYVTPGAHVVRAVVAGALVQQTPELAAGEVVALVFEAPAPAATPEPPPAPQPDRPTSQARTSSPSNGGGGGSPWLVAGGGVLTGVAVTATIVSGLATLSARDAFTDRPTAANLEAGQSLQSRTNVLLGISIGLGVMTTATAVWIVNWRGASRTDVRLRVGVAGAGAAAEWRF